MTDILKRFSGIRKCGSGWTARCPAHDDKENSLSINRGNGLWLIKCHAGCESENIVSAVGLKLSDLFDEAKRGEGVLTPPATVQPRNHQRSPWNNTRPPSGCRSSSCEATASPRSHTTEH